MINIVLVDVLHTKVVDIEGEADGAPVMMPVSWCDCSLPVSCFAKAFGEEVLRNYAGLWESIHSVSHFAENIAIHVHFVTECIFINDVLWEEFEFHPEVLLPVHGCHEVEILDVNSH